MFTDADRTVEESVFMQGAVHEVTDRLSQLPERGPFFLTLTFWRRILRSASNTIAR